VYDEYLDQVSMAKAEQLQYYALSVVGPRNRVDKLVRKLPLMPSSTPAGEGRLTR
jgi:Protein of unknown function (DUF2000)